MAYLLGVDTGGTYTDAVVIDDRAQRVLGKAKSLTTRADLALGIGRAVNGAILQAGIRAAEVAMVSLSTTLATNALVEGQGERVALVFIGFDDDDLARAGLTEALAGDPVIRLDGGHGHDGQQNCPLDLAALANTVAPLGPQVMGFAVAARFATRNPAHEQAARALIRSTTGRPVTCSHELSAQLNGPKRALTAVLNARLIGMIDRLIGACERHLAAAGITAPLMVTRGDGALISAAMVRERPIETILSGPAASLVGARWLTGVSDALVSDIGGTTTDVCLLHDGRPKIDPAGALVGGFRTMVEAVAMRTTGLGGDSEVHLTGDSRAAGIGATGLPICKPNWTAALRLGPRRLCPISLLATEHPQLVHAELDRILVGSSSAEHDGRFVLPLAVPDRAPDQMQTVSRAASHGQIAGLSPREAALLSRIDTAMPLSRALQSRVDLAALDRLIARGLVMLAGVTPSDACHVLVRQNDWDRRAAEKALQVMARRRDANGNPFAKDAQSMAKGLLEALSEQTVTSLLEVAFHEDPGFSALPPDTLARHPLTRAGLGGHQGVLTLQTRLAVPVVGLGASAPIPYPAVGKRLGCEMILPEHADVANAIGAVVGQVSQRVSGLVSSPEAGRYVAHLPEGPRGFGNRDQAMEAMETALRQLALARARGAGTDAPVLQVHAEITEAEVEGQKLFIEASVTVTATGRPRIAEHPLSDAG
jgi:N-methylhydantoinase A/oxoprolinase/acetone carboxylase beta subunit